MAGSKALPSRDEGSSNSRSNSMRFTPLAQAFDHSLLVQPHGSRYRSGVFEFEATSLMGTRSIFRTTVVETDVPMDETHLYLLDTRLRQPLELVPLFRVMASPRTEATACYFYNRLDRNGVRWVSYHFEQEAEFLQPREELASFLSDLHSVIEVDRNS
jgi:hypothetical protein